MTPPTPRAPHRTEAIIGRLLQVGVWFSLLLLVSGTLVSFLHSGRYGQAPGDVDRLIGKTGEFPLSWPWFFEGLRELRGQALIVLGLVVLIATPVLRVAVSIVAFAIERDWSFVIITSVVLMMLATSLLLGM